MMTFKEMNNKNVTVGTILTYRKCSCGDVNMTIGGQYEVQAVKFPMVVYLDDKGEKRVKTLRTGCFVII